MNEAETRAELIDPALKAAGWGMVDGSRIRLEQITKGRLQGSGKRSKQLIADYVLTYRTHKLAIIEAKRRDLDAAEGVQQAKEYAARLKVRFTYATNGDTIYQIDMLTGKEGSVEKYPIPDELWQMTFAENNEWRNRFAAVPFEDKGGMWEARYYQHNAIDKTLEAIAAGKQRILLTLATGTGKTAIAFQIAWKLFHSRWNLKREPTRLPRILFLADRNILANQAYNSFSAFDDDAMVRIDPAIIRQRGMVPKNGSIFFTIFQTFMSGTDEEGNSSPNFGDYPPDFFDFIIIDECHRGGANDESNWRAIMEYFSPAVQLGLTATPKRKGNVDTYRYFGDPIYVYSLMEGINDGYLTPFRVKIYASTLDDYIYNPDDQIVEGEIEEGKLYGQDDFNKIIEIKAREASRVETFMEAIDQKQKTLVFCATQDHAAAVRDLINQAKDSNDPNYCVRVTARDGAIGDQHLRTFQDNEKTIPTILTTSQKLSTGVDARNIRNIILMRPINSMIEFKQIIGRGTRLYEGKNYFIVYDFVKAYERFQDDDWDGPLDDPTPCKKCGNSPCTCEKALCEVCGERPCVCLCPTCGEKPCVCEKEPCPECGEWPCVCKKRVKIELADGTIRYIVSTILIGPKGKPMTSAEFINCLFGELPKLFEDEEHLRGIWGKPDTRKKLLDGLADKGFGESEIAEAKTIIEAENSDVFDVLAYIAYELKPITREERVNSHKDNILPRYQDSQKEFLQFILGSYVDDGVETLDTTKLADLLVLKYGGLHDAERQLGHMPQIRETFVGFQEYLYGS